MDSFWARAALAALDFRSRCAQWFCQHLAPAAWLAAPIRLDTRHTVEIFGASVATANASDVPVDASYGSFERNGTPIRDCQGSVVAHIKYGTGDLVCAPAGSPITIWGALTRGTTAEERQAHARTYGSAARTSTSSEAARTSSEAARTSSEAARTSSEAARNTAAGAVPLPGDYPTADRRPFCITLPAGRLPLDEPQATLLALRI